MNIELIQRMQSQFETLAQSHPDEAGLEFWFARDPRKTLGYPHWENFHTAIKRAIESCKTSGYEAEHQFRGVTKLITRGKQPFVASRLCVTQSGKAEGKV